MALPRITDPRHEPISDPGMFERWGLSLINDERDLPFLKLMASFTLVLLPLAVLQFFYFRWWLGVIHIAVLFGMYFDRGILMLHNTSHRVLFKPKYRMWNHYIPWILCPLYGQPPEAYFGHHMGMHHPENNLEDDLSTTMPYQRDRFLHFLHYWAVFMVSTLPRLTKYLWSHNRKRLAINAAVGETLYVLVCVVGLIFKPEATFVVFVLPYLLARFLMMWGNWGQHAFVDQNRPEVAYVNSITCINTRYNRRCFNDGYHIGHHVKANRHWTDMPKDLEDSAERYAKEGAIVFEGIDFFQVSLYLFLKRYDWLAERFIECGSEQRSKEEIIAFLKTRLRPVVREKHATEMAAQAA